MKISELAIRYGNTGKWVDDNPVCDPNYWCSMCGKRLYSLVSVRFTINRFNKKDLDFEYHTECVIEALNEFKRLSESRDSLKPLS